MPDLKAEMTMNFMFFIEGKNNSLLVDHGKYIMAKRGGGIVSEGYANVLSSYEKEKCIIADGISMRFTLPESFDKLLYNIAENDCVAPETIEYWKAVDKSLNEFVICRYKTYSSRHYRTVDSNWNYTIFAYIDGEFFKMPKPVSDSRNNIIVYENKEEYEPYFMLVNKINTPMDSLRHVVVITNPSRRLITYNHKLEKMDTSVLTSDRIYWSEYAILDNEDMLKKDIKRTMDSVRYLNYHIEVKCLDKKEA